MEDRGQAGSLSRLGAEEADLARLAWFSVEERDTACCYARQD